MVKSNCNDLCHTAYTITPIHCRSPYTMTPIHHHSPYTVYTPSASSISTSCYDVSGGTSSTILLVHLVMAFTGQHRQPHHFYIVLWIFRVDIVSHIIGTSYHCMSSSRPSAQ